MYGKVSTLILALSCTCNVDVAVAQTLPEMDRSMNDITLNDLPAVDRPFKIAPYVRAAVHFQKMGKEKGCEHLTKLAAQGDKGQVAILCRMLFSKKTNMPFRPPHFGAGINLGGSSDDDWPLSPIELVDAVPFFIVDGYNLGGERESSLHYLNLCREQCEWSNTRFDKVDDKSIKKALQKVLQSGKWKTPLTTAERQYLNSQAE